MVLKQFAFSQDEVDLLRRMILGEMENGNVTTGDEAKWFNTADDLRTLLSLHDQLKGDFRPPKGNNDKNKNNEDWPPEETSKVFAQRPS